MKTLGYRRVAGAIGLTDHETGARGAWVEKRVALFDQLIARGWAIIPLSRFTKATAEAFGKIDITPRPVDVLFLEFGGTNAVFNGKDWDETVRIVTDHAGPVYFLSDDPDLTFLWDRLPDEDWSRWTILVNAANPEAARQPMKVPAPARILDYPAHIGMTPASFAGLGNGECVYLGRPNGRARQLAPHLEHLTVAGKATEWAKFSVQIVDQPSQADRRSFYRQFSAAFAAFDNKHAATGWRTGRAYHALYAGIPVVVPDSTNKGLHWAHSASEGGLLAALRLTPQDRERLWRDQIRAARKVTPDWEAIGL